MAASVDRWQWLEGTYWYVPHDYLLALASSPALKSPLPVSDQTVYHIARYEDGYFWGTTAVSYSPPRGSSAPEVSCLQLVGSVTPEGQVHLTFTLLPSETDRRQLGQRADGRARHDDPPAGRLDHGKSNVHRGRQGSAAHPLGLYVPMPAERALLWPSSRRRGVDPGVSRAVRASRGWRLTVRSRIGFAALRDCACLPELGSALIARVRRPPGCEESGCGCRDAFLPAADHRAARCRRGQPSARGPGRVVGVARRRQRRRCRGRDRARAVRRRADDVGSRRRRVLSGLRPGERPRASCSTAPARRPPRPRRSAMPAASRAPARCRFRCRACSRASS